LPTIRVQQFNSHIIAFEANERRRTAIARYYICKLSGPQSGQDGQVADKDGGNSAEPQSIIGADSLNLATGFGSKECS
jgi:hypothetical protein